MLFKDELIISLQQSGVRRAAGAPPPGGDAIKGPQVTAALHRGTRPRLRSIARRRAAA